MSDITSELAAGPGGDPAAPAEAAAPPPRFTHEIAAATGITYQGPLLVELFAAASLESIAETVRSYFIYSTGVRSETEWYHPRGDWVARMTGTDLSSGRAQEMTLTHLGQTVYRITGDFSFARARDLLVGGVDAIDRLLEHHDVTMAAVGLATDPRYNPSPYGGVDLRFDASPFGGVLLGDVGWDVLRATPYADPDDFHPSRGLQVFARGGFDVVHADDGDWVDLGVNAPSYQVDGPGYSENGRYGRAQELLYGHGNMTLDLAGTGTQAGGGAELRGYHPGVQANGLDVVLGPVIGHVDFGTLTPDGDDVGRLDLLNLDALRDHGWLEVYGSSGADTLRNEMDPDVTLIFHVDGADVVDGGTGRTILQTDDSAVMVADGFDATGASGTLTRSDGDVIRFTGVEGHAFYHGGTMLGSGADETFYVLYGMLTVDGGDGVDTLVFRGTSVEVHLDGPMNGVLRNGGAVMVEMTNIENVVTQEGYDVVYGDAGDNYVDTGGGEDVIYLGQGADTARGGFFGDVIDLGSDPAYAAGTVSDGDADVVTDLMWRMNGDEVTSFGWEDSILVEARVLTPAQVSWDGATGTLSLGAVRMQVATTFDGTAASVVAVQEGENTRIHFTGPDAPANLFPPVAVDPALPRQVMETGMVEVGHQAVEVLFSGRYENPVVIAAISGARGWDVAVADVFAVGAGRFSVRIAEPEGYDGVHVAEQVAWMVVEAGAWELSDGSIIEAGLHGASDAGVSAVHFAADFGGADPVLLGSTQRLTGYDHVRVAENVLGQVGLTLEAEEQGRAGPAEVGWVALSGGAEFWQAATGRGSGNARWLTFDEAFDETPVAIAGLASRDGIDPGVVRALNISETAMQLQVMEDVAWDRETRHRAEDINWVAFETGVTAFGESLL